MPPITTQATRERGRKHQTGVDGEKSHSGASSNRTLQRAQARADQPSGRAARAAAPHTTRRQESGEGAGRRG
eukprot:4988064-Pyramimonas_sp.AAC.1